MASNDPSLVNEKPIRFASLDLLRGIALVLILEAHLGIWWGDPSWYSAWALTQIVIRPVGPVNFIIASIFGTMVSISLKERGGITKGLMPQLWKRFLLFLIIGSVLNFINLWRDIVDPNVLVWFKLLRILFTWNIFTFLAFAQIIVQFARKLPAWANICFVMGIFVYYYLSIPVFVRILENHHVDYHNGDLFLSDIPTGYMLVYFLLFFENSMAPFIPWMSVTFLVVAVYNPLVKCVSSPGAGRDEVMAKIHRVQKIAVFLLVTGVLIGFSPSPACMKQIDLLGKTRRLTSILISFGKYSLTVFLTHALFSFIPLALPYLGFLLAVFIVAAGYIAGLVYWDRRWGGKYSIEWLVKFFLYANITALIQQPRNGKKNGG